MEEVKSTGPAPSDGTTIHPDELEHRQVEVVVPKSIGYNEPNYSRTTPGVYTNPCTTCLTFADPHPQPLHPSPYPYVQQPPYYYQPGHQSYQAPPPYPLTTPHQPPAYGGPHNIVRQGPPSPQYPSAHHSPAQQYIRPPQSPPNFPHHSTFHSQPPQQLSSWNTPQPPMVNVQNFQHPSPPAANSPPVYPKSTRSRPAKGPKKAESEPQLRKVSNQTLRVPRHSADTSSSEESSTGTSGRSFEDGRSKLKRSTSADHAEWLATLRDKTVSSLLRHKSGKAAALPPSCPPDAAAAGQLSEAFGAGPNLALSDAGRTVQGRSTHAHRWPATALGTLQVPANSTKRHRWTVTHLNKGLLPPLVGIAPESVDSTKSNNQRLAGGGWYLSLNDCTLYSGGSSSSPRLKGATVGLPDRLIPEGESVIIELDPTNRLLSFTAHGEKVTAYRSIDCREPFRLSVLLSFGSQVAVTQYSEEESQPM